MLTGEIWLMSHDERDMPEAGWLRSTFRDRASYLGNKKPPVEGWLESVLMQLDILSDAVVIFPLLADRLKCP